MSVGLLTLRRTLSAVMTLAFVATTLVNAPPAAGQQSLDDLPANSVVVEAEDFVAASGDSPRRLDCAECSNGAKIGFFWPGTWLELAVEIPVTGEYLLYTRANNGFGDPARVVMTDTATGEQVGELVVIPSVEYLESEKQTVFLEAGSYTFRFTNTSAVADLDVVVFEANLPVDPNTLTQDELDTRNAIEVGEVVDALNAFQESTGLATPQPGGLDGLGTGFFHRSGTSRYPTSVAATLVERGLLNPLNLPANLWHADTAVAHPDDFLIRECDGRLGVFIEAPTLAPSDDDAAWWATNNCGVETRRNYFVLTTDQTALFDVVRARDAAAIARAVTGYQDRTGLAAVDGGGWRGLGVGPFQHEGSANYPTSISSVLLDMGLLWADDLPRNPTHIDIDGERWKDFYLRSCKGRIGVFIEAPTLAPSDEDAAWWATNNCPADPRRDFFVLTDDRSATQDAVASIEAYEIVAALDAYQADTGEVSPRVGGFRDLGVGLFRKEGSGGYTTSIASELVALGYLAADDLPRHPHHANVARQSRWDFYVHRCGSRVGVFVEAPSLQPSAADAEWWNDRNCRLDNRRNYFVLTGNDPINIANPLVTAGPDRNPLKGWMSSWFTGLNADDAQEQAFVSMTSLGYQTLAWGDFEPVDGEYNRQAVEDLLARPGSKDRHVVLQFYVDWGNGEYHGPDWLIADGMVEELPERRIVDENGNVVARATNYDDPDFIREATDAIDALMTMYKDDPRIHVIQLGLLGYFAEWHTHPYPEWGPSVATQEAILAAYEPYLDEVYTQARTPDPAENPVTTPRPGMGYTNGWVFPDDHGLPFGQYIGENGLWANGPIGGEWPPNRLPEQGEGGRQQDWINVFGNEHEPLIGDGFELIRTGGYSHISPPKAEDIASQVDGWTVADERFQGMHKAMGYNFHIGNVRHSLVGDGTRLDVSFDVLNSGITQFYEDWNVQVAVLDETGAPVPGLLFDVADLDIRTWMPGDRNTVAVSADGFDLDPNGTYRLGVRILQPGADEVKAAAWKLDPRNAYVRFANDIEVTAGAWIDGALVGGWNIVDTVSLP